MTRVLAHLALAGTLSMLPAFAPTVADAAPRTLVQRDGGGAKIALYDSLCDEDNHLECLIAEIGCDGPGDFTASLFAFEGKDAATLFAKANGKGQVTAAGYGESLQITKVALSEFSYKWNATMISYERGRQIWSAIWSADAVELQAGTRKVTLRRGDVEQSGFRDVVSTCAAAAR